MLAECLASWSRFLALCVCCQQDWEVGAKGPVNCAGSPRSLSPKGWWSAWWGLKALSLAARMPESLSSLLPGRTRCSVCSPRPTVWCIKGIPLGLDACFPLWNKWKLPQPTGYKVPSGQRCPLVHKERKLLKWKQPRSGSWPLTSLALSPHTATTYTLGTKRDSSYFSSIWVVLGISTGALSMWANV
jgi:hypothetical protein